MTANNSLNQEQTDGDSLEQRKLAKIAKRSWQFVVLSGPSGSGKEIIIKHLVEKYGFVEPPFVTTRELRPGEAEIGGVKLDINEFSREEMKNSIFLPAHNYGNAYGYTLDVIFDLVEKNNSIVVEAPASNLISDVSRFLPEATIIGILPQSIEEIEEQLKQRNLNNDSDRETRMQSVQAVKDEIIAATKAMEVREIIPTHGVLQDTIDQIDRLMEERRAKIEE